jgi:hypothetical protein
VPADRVAVARVREYSACELGRELERREQAVEVRLHPLELLRARRHLRGPRVVHRAPVVARPRELLVRAPHAEPGCARGSRRVQAPPGGDDWAVVRACERTLARATRPGLPRRAACDGPAGTFSSARRESVSGRRRWDMTASSASQATRATGTAKKSDPGPLVTRFGMSDVGMISSVSIQTRYGYWYTNLPLTGHMFTCR